MASPRRPGAPGTPPPVLELDFAAELGRSLSAARAQRGISVEDVAGRLLLSTRQVRALESADVSAFHSPTFFARGLRKYLEFAGVAVPDDLFERLLELTPDGRTASPKRDRDAASRGGGTSREGRATRAATPKRGWGVASREAGMPRENGWRSPGLLGVAGLAGALLLAGTWYLEPRLRPSPPSAADPAAGESLEPDPLPAVPLLLIADLAAPVAEVRAPRPVVQPPPQPALPEGAAAAGTVAVSRPTWVFIRYANNQTVERRIGPGSPLRLTGVPVYIAVGIAEGVRVELGGEDVDVEPHVQNGQVRIGRAALEPYRTRRP
ncbi:MAG: RodZ domain-containing protein [Acidobacteriota bacterium]